MRYFYVKNDEPYIPDRINPDLVKLAKAIIKTCRLSFKYQMKTTALQNALRGGDPAQMAETMQKCMEKNRSLYESDMALSGAKIREVDDAFFADRDAAFYRDQLQILIDFAAINCVIEARAFPLMSAACEKTLGKKIDELLFFMNQGEILSPADAAEEAETAPEA